MTYKELKDFIVENKFTTCDYTSHSERLWYYEYNMPVLIKDDVIYLDTHAFFSEFEEDISCDFKSKNTIMCTETIGCPTITFYS